MHEDQMRMLLSEILGGGYADLDILSGTKYGWSQIIERAKESDAQIDLGGMFFAIVNIGLDNLSDFIKERIKELNAIDDISHEELNELAQLQILDTGNDFEIQFNYSSSDVYLIHNEEVYREFLDKQLDFFEDNTGFNIQ